MPEKTVKSRLHEARQRLDDQAGILLDDAAQEARGELAVALRHPRQRALWQVADASLAEEVTQAVFLQLELNGFSRIGSNPLEALKRNAWNVTRSAEETGMQRANFQALMKKHDIRLRGAEQEPDAPAAGLPSSVTLIVRNL